MSAQAAAKRTHRKEPASKPPASTEEGRAKEAKRPHASPRLDVPGAIEETDVPDILDAAGVPVKLRAVRTFTPIEELDAHFRRVFDEDGLFIPDGDAFSPTPFAHVTALDLDTNTSYSVIFQPNPDGSTNVLIGIAYLHAARSEKPVPFVPAYPGARRVMVSEMETGATLSYAVDVSPEAVTGFYRETFDAAGYTEDGPLTFVRDGEVITVHARRRDTETSVVVLRTHRGATAER
ncbi:MAG: hypothetical protein IRZ16_03015 [Myxococcaceae bacterium]|nr:hypothetical protein [Myxococcaceae bacterium]